MTPDHATVLAAIDKVREPCTCESDGVYCPEHSSFRDRNAHCDDLRELVTFHHPNGGGPCVTCLVADGYDSCLVYRIVIERLTAWGAF